VFLHSQTTELAASPPELAGERVVILSAREKQLLRRLAHGQPDKLIVAEIGGTEMQIGMQRERLIEKLRIQSQEQLVTLAGQRAGSSKYVKKGRR
jgi:DNA-binding CsgD family transcriptional regulator